jgi:hypothetical protein
MMMRPSFRNLAVAGALGLTLASLAACAQNPPAAFEPKSYGTGGNAPLSCVPNLDGMIEASELAPVLSTPIAYTVSPPGTTRAVDLVGEANSGGELTWDFSMEYANDEVAMLTAVPMTGLWFAKSFPGGQYATPLDAAATLIGVYSSDDTAISLLGYASSVEKPSSGQTLIVYEAPVAVFQLPLAPGKSWISTGQVHDGMIDGLPYSGTDTYQVSDDALGQITIPDFVFTQAHRVRTKLTVSPSVGEATELWQVQFMFECFGEVARATSQDGEMDENFTTAAELRRLGK